MATTVDKVRSRSHLQTALGTSLLTPVPHQIKDIEAEVRDNSNEPFYPTL